MCFYTLFNFFFCLLKMQNEYLNEFTPAEAIKQVSQYFSIIDNSVQVGDTNRKYVPSKNAASPGGPQADNSYITFNISPVGENLCDLYNSTIQAVLNMSVKVSSAVTGRKTQDGNYPAVWIGYVDSMDSVSTYQILANGRSIYTQDNAHNESFITGCGATEAVKKVDIFSKARHADVWKRADTAKSGYIIDFKSDVSANGTISDIKIPIKIDLRRFLVLDAIRYMPAFAGNIQLKIKFSTEALQVAPLSVEDMMVHPFDTYQMLTNYPKITNKFVPFEEQFTMITAVTINESNNTINSYTLTTGTQKFTKSSATFNECFSYLNCFSLDPNVYQDLINRYSQTALSFPIKRMDWTTMSGDPVNISETANESTSEASATKTYTATFTPTYVNAIYVLFKRKPNYYTNYENPLFESYQLNMGAYGNIPADPENTYGPIFYETCANAMNTNNDLCGFNVDVMRSLTTTHLESTGYKSNDTTHFFMGFPTETDFTFQQGQTSNSPITYKLTVKKSNPNEQNAKTSGTVGFLEKPEIGFLRHVCFSIMVKPNGPPVVVIDDYDLSQPDA